MYINKSRSYLGRTYDFKVFIICNEKVQRETYIEWIEMIIGLNDLERECLCNEDIRKMRFRYKMTLQEKTVEIEDILYKTNE
ncbi:MULTISPECIES: hypothetical protein [Staphylococcus]|jgi:desulfoferrodoxin (superoxide reductase-like protein)|uniref:hypothetical protein n=1 Tax=Staphylococcus TaxID=1279 RepID=UPI0005090BA7|nr:MULTISPECIES: hypothetical protein [Staphylococcus]MDU1594454.1 hypothetical protein [Staphylococcus lugdunensis]MDU4845092.1 hypothetical protein [Streptococcus mitis]AIR83900.1 hypothetical protein DP17_2423 [Staphylococcus epidermidis]MDF1470319.1 hypothetical protein [Staphylococcus epidermidis]MDH8979224.1 hypothetical protein [Staphylococcus epidermidis]